MTTKSRSVQSHFQLGYQSRREELARLIGECARNLRQYAITSRERSRCDEVIRGRSLSHDGLDVLVELAARAENPLILEGAIRNAVLRRSLNPTPACVFEASEAEERTNGPMNEAQLLLARERSAIRAVQVAELGHEQLHKTRILVDAAWTFAAKVS